MSGYWRWFLECAKRFRLWTFLPGSFGPHARQTLGVNLFSVLGIKGRSIAKVNRQFQLEQSNQPSQQDGSHQGVWIISTLIILWFFKILTKKFLSAQWKLQWINKRVFYLYYFTISHYSSFYVKISHFTIRNFLPCFLSNSFY